MIKRDCGPLSVTKRRSLRRVVFAPETCAAFAGGIRGAGAGRGAPAGDVNNGVGTLPSRGRSALHSLSNRRDGLVRYYRRKKCMRAKVAT
ncbi:hypothetical protein EVAR_88785_1 [Eumeta japonica]|uniref:Uncharacterized protein n=1 Tax=Eumeta variegata TaxID=151549 RepID=A0A4C1XRF0_EUMVA|nr:hypothetical protein EVAR_88785_1 [Eumeta japonica]